VAIVALIKLIRLFQRDVAVGLMVLAVMVAVMIGIYYYVSRKD
jgi:hypothetical protein